MTYYISQGRVETPIGRVGQLCCIFVANSLQYLCAENNQNAMRFDKVIAKIKMFNIFTPQCRYKDAVSWRNSAIAGRSQSASWHVTVLTVEYNYYRCTSFRAVLLYEAALRIIPFICPSLCLSGSLQPVNSKTENHTTFTLKGCL